jgi:short subunit dehydrogenase-like uncharacterized protein
VLSGQSGSRPRRRGPPIEIATAPYIAHATAGVKRTVLDVLQGSGWVVRDGALRRHRIGGPTRIVPLPSGPRRMAAVPTGDLLAVQRATGARSVTVYTSEMPSNRLLLGALPLAALALRARPLARLLDRAVGPSAPRSAAPTVSDRESVTWGHANTAAGAPAEALLRLGEGYAVTATVAAAVAHATGTHEAPGAFTPGALLGEQLAEICHARIEPRPTS